MSEKSDAKIISEATDVKKPKGLHLLKAEKIDTPEKFARLARMTQEEFLEEAKKAGGVSELLRKAAPFRDVEIEDGIELTEPERCKNCGVSSEDYIISTDGFCSIDCRDEFNKKNPEPIEIMKVLPLKNDSLGDTLEAMFIQEPSQPKRQDYESWHNRVLEKAKNEVLLDNELERLLRICWEEFQKGE